MKSKSKFFGVLPIVLVSLTFFMSCLTTEKPLYDWYNYSSTAYDYVKKADEKSLKQLIETYEKIIAKQTGVRQTVPPGIYADYGYICIRNGEVEKGLKLLEKEIELYPESAPVVQRVIKAVKK